MFQDLGRFWYRFATVIDAYLCEATALPAAVSVIWDGFHALPLGSVVFEKRFFLIYEKKELRLSYGF